jgi:ribosome-associated protein
MKRNSDEQSPASDPRQDEVSKTRRKAQMHALQDLGEALVALDAVKLAQLDLPERLVDAVTQARSIRAHEGRRRQMQFIGKLMRDIDPVPVREAIERFASGVPSDRAEFAAAERWREDMLRDDEAVTRFAAEHPETDAAAFAALVRDARAERLRGGPPHRYRELFRKIREAAG